MHAGETNCKGGEGLSVHCWAGQDDLNNFWTRMKSGSVDASSSSVGFGPGSSAGRANPSGFTAVLLSVGSLGAAVVVVVMVGIAGAEAAGPEHVAGMGIDMAPATASFSLGRVPWCSSTAAVPLLPTPMWWLPRGASRRRGGSCQLAESNRQWRESSPSTPMSTEKKGGETAIRGDETYNIGPQDDMPALDALACEPVRQEETRRCG